MSNCDGEHVRKSLIHFVDPVSSTRALPAIHSTGLGPAAGDVNPNANYFLPSTTYSANI